MSDVFISHSSKDKEIADGLVKFLESRGISCWIAPRNIVPGNDWAASISTAITASKVFLIVYSENSSKSEQCAREIAIAEATKGVVVVPYKIDNVELVGAYQYYLTGSHWITANYKKKDHKYEELTSNIAGILGKNIQTINANTYIDHLHIGKAEDLPEDIAKAMKAKINDSQDGVTDGKTSLDNRSDKPDKQNSNKKSKMIILFGSIGAVLLIAAIVLLVILLGKKDSDANSEDGKTILVEDTTPTPIPTPTNVLTMDEHSSNTNGIKSVISFLKTEGFRDETYNFYFTRDQEFSFGDGRKYNVSVQYYEDLEDNDDASPLMLIMNTDTYDLVLMLNEKWNRCWIYATDASDGGNRNGRIGCYYKDMALVSGQITEKDIADYTEDENLSKQEFINLANSLLPIFKKCMSEYLESEMGVKFSELGFSKWQ